MASIQNDVEKGKVSKMKEPLLWKKEVGGGYASSHGGGGCSGLFMLLVSTSVAVLGSFVFGICVGYSSPAQYQIMEELNMSFSQYSFFGSILTIGAMLGSITCGRIADFAGRKGGFRLSSILCIVGSLAIYYASHPMILYVGRFFSGFGIGILTYVVPVYISEIAPSNLRGALSALNQLLIVIGIGMVYAVGAFVGWRALVLTGLVPSILLLLGLFLIPESPRWLAMVGRDEEFEAALRTLRGPYADMSSERALIYEYIETLRTLPKVTVLNLLDKVNRRPVIISVGLMVFQQFIGINGLIFYSSRIFTQAGFNPSVGSITFGIVQVVVTTAGALIIDRAGRRPLLLISASGLLLGCLLIAFSFLLKAHHLATDSVPNLAVIGSLVYIGSFSVGMGAGPSIIMSEVFPLHMKGLGGGLFTLVHWFGSWAVSYSFNFLMLWSSSGTFFLYASICFFSIIFIFKLVPETKGRTLEEIHASLNS